MIFTNVINKTKNKWYFNGLTKIIAFSYLTLDYYFNISNVVDRSNYLIIPNSVTHLIFGSNFYHSIDNLPDSVTYLMLQNTYDFKINKLPLSLKELKVSKCFIEANKDIISKNVKIIIH